MISYVKGMKRLEIPFNGGLDEISAVTQVKPKDFIELQDWRLSKDGSRLEKRKGIKTITSGFAGEDIYGLGSYKDEDDAFCLLVILESQIYRQVGGAAWASIHTFSDNIAHPVKPLEIQGKQFIINEVDSRFIHHDKNDYQIGIDKPTTPMEVRIEYDDTDLENEACDDTLVNNGWTETNVGSGNSVYVANFDGANCFRMRGSTNGGTAGDETKLEKTYAGAGTPAGNRIKVQMHLYFDDLVGIGTDRLRISIYPDADHIIFMQFNDAQMYISGILRDSAIGRVGITIEDNKWYIIELYCDMENDDIEAWITPAGGSRAYYGHYPMTTTSGATPGDMKFQLDGDTGDTDVYLDYLYIGNSTDSTTAGNIYKYGFKYARSGNFPNESNLKTSHIYAPVGFVTALDDLTVHADSEYTGSIGRTIVLKIDGTGTPDTVQISYDGGDNFYTTYLPISSTMYLNHGITLTFAATTGHAVDDIWVIKCFAQSVRKSLDETVSLTSIAVSGDAQVDQRKLYRSLAGGANYYWLITLGNNTTTLYGERTADTVLGDVATTDHDPLPSGYGKFSEWWDNRLWVTGDNDVFYSATDNPESFDELNRCVKIRKGDQHDKLTGMKAFMDNLYVFKRNSVYIIQKKAGGAYGRFRLLDGIGCMAGWSIVEANNYLMWLSDRGVELFNGNDIYSQDFSVKISSTIAAIDRSKLDYISSAHFREFSEILWSVPDTPITIVYNYLKNKFSTFSQSKAISALNVIEDSGDVLRLAVGTRDGYYGEANPSTPVYRDWGAGTITCTARKPLDFGLGADFHYIEIEYESVTSKDLTLNIYTDLDKDIAFTATLSGDTPHATDQDYRRPIFGLEELGLASIRSFDFELINADVIAGDCKINKVALYYVPRELKKSYAGD